MFFLLDSSTNPETINFIDKYLTADTLCTMITVIGSVLTVSITYYKTQKMKQFDVFFSRKTLAYENFWSAVSSYFDNKTEENKHALRCAVHCVGLYSSEKTYSQICKLVSMLFTSSSDISDCVTEISMLMRSDIDKTKKGKLY